MGYYFTDKELEQSWHNFFKSLCIALSSFPSSYESAWLDAYLAKGKK